MEGVPRKVHHVTNWGRFRLEILPKSVNFSIFRCDQFDRRGGGALAAVRNNLSVSVIHVPPSSLEMLWLRCSSRECESVIGVCYKSPDSSYAFLTDLRTSLGHITAGFPRATLILLRDFNFLDIDWCSLPSSSSMSKAFLELCLDFNLDQLINQPTRITQTISNILDLCLSLKRNTTFHCYLDAGRSVPPRPHFWSWLSLLKRERYDIMFDYLTRLECSFTYICETQYFLR